MAGNVQLHDPLDGRAFLGPFIVPSRLPAELASILPPEVEAFLQEGAVLSWASASPRLLDIRQTLLDFWGSDLGRQHVVILWYYHTLGLPLQMQGVYFGTALDLVIDVFIVRPIEKTDGDDVLKTLEKYRERSIRADSWARQCNSLQRQPMSFVSLAGDAEDTEDEDYSDDYTVTEYADADSDDDPDYSPGDESSDGSFSSMSSSSVHSPVAKRRRLYSMAQDGVLHFFSHKSLPDFDTCRRWVSLLCQLLPGLEGVSARYLGIESDQLDYVAISSGLRHTCIAAGRTRYPRPANLRQAKRKAMGWILRGMKAIPQERSLRDTWRQAVFSGLAAAIATVADPGYVASQILRSKDEEQGVIDMLRHQRLQDSLTAILLNWTPVHVQSGWVPQEILFEAKAFDPKMDSKDQRITTPAQLRKILTANPWLVPRAAVPETVFFLHSSESFLRIYDRWLGPALEANGWYLDVIGNTTKTRTNFYSRMIQYLTVDAGQKYRDGLYDDQNPVEVIFARTIEARDAKKEFDRYLKANELSKAEIACLKEEKVRPQIRSCRHCYTLPPEMQCSQICYVTRRPDMQKLKGCGISRCKRRQQDQFPSRVYSTEELGMKAVRSDPVIMERCGRHIIYIVDRDQSEAPVYNAETKSQFVDSVEIDEDGGYQVRRVHVMDGVFFGPFSKEVLKKLREHERNVAYMSPLRRGGHLQNHSEGYMYGGGAGRQAMGGGLGGGYAYYAKMEAQSLKGVHVLMDMAMDSFLIDCVAQYAFHGIWKILQATVKNADRLGISGTNVFQCRGYVAPIHQDFDACRGLCCTFAWRGVRELDEFAFCQPEWGYYIATETNVVWSFDSAYLHGTMLPSQDSFAFLDGDETDGVELTLSCRDVVPSSVGTVQVPNRASAGIHKSATAKNIAAAEKYNKAVRHRVSLCSHWATAENFA